MYIYIYTHTYVMFMYVYIYMCVHIVSSLAVNLVSAEPAGVAEAVPGPRKALGAEQCRV